jgi:hypothetical protein
MVTEVESAMSKKRRSGSQWRNKRRREFSLGKSSDQCSTQEIADHEIMNVFRVLVRVWQFPYPGARIGKFQFPPRTLPPDARRSPVAEPRRVPAMLLSLAAWRSSAHEP